MSENTLNLSDPRGFAGDRRTPPLAPFGNGKMRIALILLGAVAQLLATVGAASWASGREVDKKVVVIEERQSNQYNEVMRMLKELREDVRAMDRRR